MSRTPARCTQADITRAVRAMKKAGGNMALEIRKDGTIRIVPANDEKSKPSLVDKAEIDEGEGIRL